MGFSETSFCRHIIQEYIAGPNVLDIGSGGDPVIPTAVQIELPDEQFHSYGHCHPVTVVPQLRSEAWFRKLPFKDNVLDTVFSSHLIEDYWDREVLLEEWLRVVRPGGTLILLVPDKARFNAAVAAGGGGNANHKREWTIGEGEAWAKQRGGVEVVREGFTEVRGPADYNVIVVFRKL